MVLEHRATLLIATLVFGLPALAQATALNVFKEGQPNPIVAGTDITYTLTVSTEGPDDAANVTLSDPLPANTTFVSLAAPGDWSCTTPAVGANGTVTCTIATFTPGSAVFTLVVHTDPSLAEGSTLSNTATVTTTTNDPDQEDNVSTSDTPVTTVSDLSITKSVSPDPAPIGSTLTITLGYAAAGPSNAATVVVEDVLPAELVFQSVTAAGWSCTTPTVGTNGTVSCTQDPLAPGASGTITIETTVDAAVTPGTVISNTATIDSGTADPDSSDDSASDSATAENVSDLAVTKDAMPDPVNAGGTLTYTIGVTASGPSPAPNVSLTDILPAQTTFTSLSAPAGWSCTTPAVGANGTVSCTHTQLPAGYSDSFTLVVTVDSSLADGTPIANTATIAGDVEEDTGNNSDTATVTSDVSFDVAVTKTAPSTIFAGNSMTYSIAWVTAGPSVPTAVTIADVLPAATRFASVSAPDFTCTTPAVGANGTVSCTAATLMPGGSGTIDIVVTVDPATPPATPIVNTATVSATDDRNSSNDQSTATTVVSAPTVTGTKTVGGPPTPIPGSSITYTIVLTNSAAFPQGDNPGDEFVDILPPALTLVSASATSGVATANVGTNTVSWNGSIPAGGSVTITIIATVDAGTEGQTVSNQGTINFDGDGNGTNESSTVTQAPGGGPTVFVVGALLAAVPALSPSMLLLVAAMLAMAGWVVVGRR